MLRNDETLDHRSQVPPRPRDRLPSYRRCSSVVRRRSPDRRLISRRLSLTGIAIRVMRLLRGMVSRVRVGIRVCGLVHPVRSALAVTVLRWLLVLRTAHHSKVSAVNASAAGLIRLWEHGCGLRGCVVHLLHLHLFIQLSCRRRIVPGRHRRESILIVFLTTLGMARGVEAGVLGWRRAVHRWRSGLILLVRLQLWCSRCFRLVVSSVAMVAITAAGCATTHTRETAAAHLSAAAEDSCNTP